MENKTFLDEVVGIYESGIAEQNILIEQKKQLLLESVKEEICKSAKHGCSFLRFRINGDNLLYVDFLKSWLLENKLIVKVILEEMDRNQTVLNISGWMK